MSNNAALLTMYALTMASVVFLAVNSLHGWAIAFFILIFLIERKK